MLGVHPSGTGRSPIEAHDDETSLATGCKSQDIHTVAVQSGNLCPGASSEPHSGPERMHVPLTPHLHTSDAALVCTGTQLSKISPTGAYAETPSTLEAHTSWPSWPTLAAFDRFGHNKYAPFHHRHGLLRLKRLIQYDPCHNAHNR